MNHDSRSTDEGPRTERPKGPADKPEPPADVHAARGRAAFARLTRTGRS